MQRDEGERSDNPAEDRPEDRSDARPHEAVEPDSAPVSHEDAWASIVANFGERAVLEPDPPTAPPRTPAPAEQAEAAASGRDDEPIDFDELMEREDRFVPPEPPPVPIPPPDRFVAWLGVFGSPAVLLVCLVAGISLPTVVGWILVAGFIGGFCYLVARTPGTPRDPWDDGSRV